MKKKSVVKKDHRFFKGIFFITYECAK
jgi:hypothetical protein